MLAADRICLLRAWCAVTDTNTANNACSTDAASPQVTLAGPNGGEIIDTGSSYTVSWEASDDIEIASQDLWLSTDGGASYSPAVTGLAGDVSEYAWTAPVIVNNRRVRLRVVARDAACNVAIDESDADFTIWTPPASFTHVAEAPMYIASGGFNANIHLCNTSSSSIVVELGLRRPSGEATASEPAQIALAPGECRKVAASDYLSLDAPADPNDPNVIEGGIRLRHNGSADGDVQAMIAVDKDGEEQSFTTPFIYLTSAQMADSTMQCAPMFYIDDHTSAYLALQNSKNHPVTVGVKLVYGTGEPGGPEGEHHLPEIELAGQQSIITDLKAYKQELQGARWGSIVVTAPPQSVAAHIVMRSAAGGMGFSSAFIDPKKSKSTTKVASSLMLDYNANIKPCVMICNMDTQTRVVTASFETDSGVAIPSRQVTIEPGKQKMIELDPRQLLPKGQTAMADVRLSYVGKPWDITAGAVSMAADGSCAVASRFAEPSAEDGRQFISPFFKLDARTRGVVQISNLGSRAVRAGVEMKFANSTAFPLTSDLVTVAPGRIATLDIQQYIDQVPEGVAAEGCLKLIHNGDPGTVSCAFMAMTPDPVEVPMEAGPPVCETMVFPSDIDVQPGETTVVYVTTCGGQGAVVWTASGGEITPLPSEDPDVSAASYTLPEDEDETDTVTIEAAAPGGGGTILVEVQKVKLRTIETFSPQGVNTQGRLNPDGGTQFVLTGRRPFPDVPLRVRFKQGNLDVSVDVPVDSQSRPRPDQLAGIAPPNTKFVGDAQVQVFQGDKKISKKTLCDETRCSAYYSFDPPTPPTSISVPGFNRLGGNLTITADDGGFRQFRSSIPGIQPENPRVKIEGIGFAVNTVMEGTPSTINGNVLRAPADVPSCPTEGMSPCKIITVRNPGGRNRDEVSSVVPLYNLMPGPPLSPTSVSVIVGPSRGGTVTVIQGDNLDFVDTVTLNFKRCTIDRQSRRELTVRTPSNCPQAFPFVFKDIDGVSVQAASFLYQHTLQGANRMDGEVIDVRLGNIAISLDFPITVGPCEFLDIDGADQSAGSTNCLRFRVRTRSIEGTDVRRHILFLEADATACNVANAPASPVRFNFRLVNGPRREPVSVDVNVMR